MDAILLEKQGSWVGMKSESAMQVTGGLKLDRYDGLGEA